MRTSVKILKTFSYGDDGVRARDLLAGETHEIHEHLVAGLIAEGYVELATAGSGKEKPKPETASAGTDQPPKAEIPADWSALPWPALKSLAAKVAPEAKTKPECIAAIEAEVALRAAASLEAGDTGAASEIAT